MKTKLIFLVFVLLSPFALLPQSNLKKKLLETNETKSDSINFDPGAIFLSSLILQSLPFRGESQEYYALFPGVVNQDYRGTDYLHVRGSRHDEVDYSIEGIDIRSAYSGLSLFHIIPEALSTVALHTSPDAATSHAPAMLQHRLRRGSRDFKLSVQGESDRFTPDYTSRMGTYSYGYSDYLFLAEGKLLFKDNIRFFIAGENQRFSDHYRMFWHGFTVGEPDMPLIDEWNTGMSLQELLGKDKIEIKPGNIPRASSSRFSANGIINADFFPFKFSLIGLYDWNKKQQNNAPIQNIFNPKRGDILAKKIISLSVDPEVYSKYLKLCKDQGLVMSKQVEIFMKKKNEEEKK